jgi:short-subunit dehydrogenase
MAAESKRAFLITGASSCLGRAIALEALSSGHKVVGTARNLSKARKQNPEFEQRGGKWLELDITDKASADMVSNAVADEDVDVLINNAAHGLYGVFEDMRFASDEHQRFIDLSDGSN